MRLLCIVWCHRDPYLEHSAILGDGADEQTIEMPRGNTLAVEEGGTDTVRFEELCFVAGIVEGAVSSGLGKGEGVLSTYESKILDLLV